MTLINQGIIKNKVGLINLAEELGNVSKACRIMGFSRDTFYRYKTAKEDGGVEALLNKSRRKPNLKNRVDEASEKAVVEMAFKKPAFGQARAANELRKEGICLSGAGVRYIWVRHGLETFKKRLKNLEEKMAADNVVLTESQLQALEKRRKWMSPVER
jgi:transposase